MICLRATATLLLLAPLVAGCDSVSRLSDLDPRSPSVSSGPITPASPTPTPNVTTQDLPPPPPRFGSGAGISAPTTAPDGSVLPPPGAQASALPPPGQLPGAVDAPQAGGLAPPPPGQQKVATGPTGRPSEPAASAAAAPERPTQSRLTGSWSVNQGGQGKCSLVLSNAPALDLYKAQTSGCGTGLAKVNAWELRGSEIYLYERGGGVAARLKQAGNASFNGALAKSGAPVSINK